MISAFSDSFVGYQNTCSFAHVLNPSTITRPCPTPASSRSIFLRDLKSNRVDLCCRVVTSSLFISHGTRRNTIIALQLPSRAATEPNATVIFDGDSVRHVKPDEQCIATLLRKALERFESSNWGRGSEFLPPVPYSHTFFTSNLTSLFRHATNTK